jgi:hypothetical protein
MTERWTEAKVFQCIRKMFPDGAYALLPQVRNGTGFARSTDRTADAIAVSCWPSRGLYLAGVEIKVSLHDWRRELANGAKAEDIGKYCRYWYIAAPAGVVPVGELPEKWGLIECNDKGGAKIVKAAVANEETPIDMPLLASICRSVSQITVPKCEVAKQIAEAVETRIKAEIRNMAFERDQALERIARFEEASGITLARYNETRIGEAVRQVLANKHLNAEDQLRMLADVAQRTLDAANKGLAVYACAVETEEGKS